MSGEFDTVMQKFSLPDFDNNDLGLLIDSKDYRLHILQLSSIFIRINFI